MVSVIIPVYNAGSSILKCLNSVKQQTEGIFEIVIINDGSTDNSSKLIGYFIENNPQIKIVLINQKNIGVSKARNAGLKVAKGEYIAFLDSDDEWLPKKTETQLKFLENFDVDFLATLRNGEKIRFPYSVDKKLELAKITLNKLLVRIEGQTSTVIFKRKILENTGFFDESQNYSEDANFWMRISKNNKMYILPESLVITGNGKRSFGESGLSANLSEMEKGIQKNIREIYLSKRINTFEYIIYLIFSKLKYLLRQIRTKL